MTITVATNNARIRYTATSGQTAFAIPFEFFENDEIYVYVAATTLVAADEKTQGTGSTHYAVSGGGGSTGTVTFVTGITQGYIVTIVRDIPIERITDFTAGSTINRAALNTQLDTLTAMVGDLKDKSDRAIRLQPYDSEISLFLPTIANRAGKIFGFDTNGNLTADTSANFDITLDDVVTNTLTMSGNPNSKINLTAVLDSQILTNGAVLNIKSTKGSNTADIKLDGSTTYGIDLNAGNKAIRLQDATLFSSTIESSGAATLSSVLTNTITSSGDFTLSSAAQGINIKPATSSTDFLATNGSQTIGVISSEGTAHLKWYQNSNNTLLKVVNPTGTRTLLLPDESGTIHSSGGTTTHSNITVSSDGKVQFRDADIYIQSGADGHLDLVADTEIHIAATTVNVDGLMDISGNLSVGGTFDVTGTIDFSDANITNVGLISLDKITNDGGAGITLDSSVGIVLDAGSGQIVFKDDNTTRLTVAINSGSTQSITSVAGLKLNSGTDITLEADGGQVYITDPSGNDNFQFNGASSPTLGIHQNSNVTNLGLVDPTATRTILFPDASDTLVGKATTDTLTNKTLASPTVTGNIAHAGDFTLDVAGDINLDADGGDVNLKDGGTPYAHLSNSSLDLFITNPTSDKDIHFRGNDSDGGGFISALTLDMSAAGKATFSGDVLIPRYLEHAGDSDTFIGFSAADQFDVTTGGTERMRISSGFVGIGATNADTPLTIQPAAQGAGTNSVQSWMYSLTSGSEFDLKLNQVVSSGLVKYSFTLRNNGTSYADNLVLDRGNVGIGVTPNSGALAVQAGTNAEAIHVIGRSSGDIGQINFFENDYSTVIGRLDGRADQFILNAVPAIPLKFNTNNTTRMTIDSSGKVGIGVSNPADYYSDNLVISAPSEGGITIASTATNNGNYICFADGTSGTARYSGMFGYSHATDHMFFSTTGTERMRIDSSGNVGIGTSSPSAGLTIQAADGSTSGTIMLTATSVASAGMACNASGLNFGADTGGFVFKTGASANDPTDTGTARLTIDDAGRFYVPGAYSSTTGSSANVNVASDGRFERSTSSLRYKNTIKDATHGLTDLLKLRSITYKGNNDGDIVFGGLIAEEVHDAGLTEFVQYDDEGKPDALAYGNMVSLCVKAIQELEARITALEG